MAKKKSKQHMEIDCPIEYFKKEENESIITEEEIDYKEMSLEEYVKKYVKE